jgi:dihydroorotase-like cyclic amidohydrolase
VGLDQAAFFERMALAPAEVLGESAGPLAIGSTDVVVFDPAAEWVYERPRSKSANSPWLAHTLQGEVTQVFTGSGLVSTSEEGVK